MKTAVSLFKSIIFSVVLLIPAICVADEPINLNVQFSAQQQQRIELEFEHKGSVVLTRDEKSEDDKYQRLPMKTVAKLGYFQRFTGKGKTNQAIRYYDQAEGRYEVHSGKTGAALNKSNRLVVVRARNNDGKRVQMASIVNTLSQAELDLLRNPLDPLSIPGLINQKNVAVGKKWKPTDDALATFLAADRIIRNDVKVSVRDIKGGIARIFVVGKLRAAIDDVTTAIEMSSEIRVAMGQTQTLKNVKLNIREIRQPGQIAPGFDGRTSIALTATDDNSCKFLTASALAKLTKGRVVEQRLQLKAPGLLLKYDPRWRVIASEDEAAILRFLSNGSLMAQCNIVKLPSRPASRPLTMKDYRKEIAKIIAADDKAKIVHTDNFRTADKSEVLSIEVRGEEENVPISWVYYHVNHTDGRRVTVVFTLEAEVIDNFRPHDKKLVQGLAFQKVVPPSPSVREAVRELEGSRR